MRKRILEQPIDVITKSEAVYRVEAALNNSRKLKIVTLNPEMVIEANKNFEFQSAINNANLIVADGTGILWALKLKGISNTERIPGIELAETILELANTKKNKVAVFGSKKETLEKCIQKLVEKFPNINFVKTIDGYMGKENDSNVAEQIANKQPDIVFVALGSPRQEIWINKNEHLFPKSILIGIGGSLDVWSGKKMRAPKWLRERNLEWLFRLLTEPKRTTRILRTLPLFVWMALKNKFCT